MAVCWSGSMIICKDCGNETIKLEDEDGSLSDGGSYERFKCTKCNKIMYIELPD